MKKPLPAACPVLIDDDDESVRWVLEKALTQTGYPVTVVTDGSEAKAALDAGSFHAAVRLAESLVS